GRGRRGAADRRRRGLPDRRRGAGCDRPRAARGARGRRALRRPPYPRATLGDADRRGARLDLRTRPRPMSAPRVLYMGNSLDVGGSEVLGLEIFRRLHPGRFEIEAICLKARGTLADEYERAGVRVEAQILHSTYDPL